MGTQTKTTNFRRQAFAIALLCVVIGGATLSFTAWKRYPKRGVSAKSSQISVPAMVRSLRPTYPHSVIPGGAYSADELRAQLHSDRIAQNHYSDFDLDHTHLTKAEKDESAYVSYRQHDRIFWTKNKLRIPKGELLLTDGHHLARSRCGNRIADRRPADAQASSDEPLADLQMPTYTQLPVDDARLTFSHPLSTEEAAAASSTADDLGWNPMTLPFSWTAKTESLSASAPEDSGSSGLGLPLVLPAMGAFSNAQSNPVNGGTTPGSSSNPLPIIGGVPTQTLPLVPVPEPDGSLCIGLALLSLAGIGLARTRH